MWLKGKVAGSLRVRICKDNHVFDFAVDTTIRSAISSETRRQHHTGKSFDIFSFSFFSLFSFFFLFLTPYMLDPDDDLLLLTHPKLQAMKIGRGGTGTRPTPRGVHWSLWPLVNCQQLFIHYRGEQKKLPFRIKTTSDAAKNPLLKDPNSRTGESIGRLN